MHYSVDMFKEKTSSSVKTEQNTDDELISGDNDEQETKTNSQTKQNTDNELVSGDSHERETKTESQTKPTKRSRDNRQNSGNSTKRGKGSNEELTSSWGFGIRYCDV